MSPLNPRLDMSVSVARYEHERRGWKNLSKRQDRISARKWFAELLWVAFPGETEHQVCLAAAPVLEVSEKSVQNWLRCQNDAPVGVVAKTMLVAGAEVVFQTIERAP